MILENKKSEEKKSTFKLKSFMKQKILGLYGINKSKIEDVPKDADDIMKLMPHDNTKI